MSEVTKKEICPNCHGQRKVCGFCRGKGEVSKQDSLTGVVAREIVTSCYVDENLNGDDQVIAETVEDESVSIGWEHKSGLYVFEGGKSDRK